tara:strand:- start:209 stop:415 length:207 start_codon:yes stop_codon:yes gene_type:complete
MFILLNASTDLCDLPSTALDKKLGFHPGLFEHGPEEKNGFAGFILGLVSILYLFSIGNYENISKIRKT